ncbi:uncharacterized protein BCR38DRAFT_436436 [Pseudomassariella vexata]|uniref:Uncharacterized protein n=1 Tax=Pseudomassariella vexata TaxID=1141098 RepID=A0A1Y2DVI8_9PEZI|nr:uncharacterized protein BCR38DRAFT_436436 [Pseudomassariella vexata]ORY63291.1 hypothetical protein BCR38DRAFT_436436 [Pseudomassariella vexata]
MEAKKRLETQKKVREEMEAKKKLERQDAEEKARKAEMITDADDFKLWMLKTELAMCQRDHIRTIPQPKAIACNDPVCKDTMGALRVSFCRHGMQKLLNAYVKIHKSEDWKERFLCEQKRVWHPDRFTRCPEDVRSHIQQVAEELMKVMAELK